jgi:hypothetical protein
MKQRWRVVLLIIWTIGILFPFFFMRRFSHLYKTGFDWAFQSNIAHVVMHVFLYAVFAWLVLSVFFYKNKIITPFIVVLMVLFISMLQESIQLVSIKSPVGWDDAIDILVDVSGAIIGISVFRWKRAKGKLGVERRTRSSK